MEFNPKFTYIYRYKSPLFKISIILTAILLKALNNFLVLWKKLKKIWYITVIS
jgi:hypothetical protein